MTTITSFSNPKIKNLLKLIKKRKKQQEDDLIIIEGQREIELAWQSGVKIKEMFYSPECSKQELKLKKADFPIFTVNQEIFTKISFKDNPDGLLVLASRPKKIKLSKIKLLNKPLILVLEGIEKPGNLGAILRTADSAGVDAILISQERTDIYNPNVIRASLGSVFSKQIAVASQEEIFSWLKDKNISIVATVVDTSKNYTEINYKKGIALLMGEEHLGLSKEWQEKADEKVKIPMKGLVNSLNVSVSASIVIYEALRQRSV